MSTQKVSGWEVRDRLRSDDTFEFSVERTRPDGKNEYAAKCWDYGLACVIEATLNLRDGTVD